MKLNFEHLSRHIIVNYIRDNDVSTRSMWRLMDRVDFVTMLQYHSRLDADVRPRRREEIDRRMSASSVWLPEALNLKTCFDIPSLFPC